MSLKLADRVSDTTTTTGTGTVTLAGSPPSGYQSFGSVLLNGDTTFYCISDTSGNWETGLGTYSTTGPTLARTQVFQSSNSNALVSFGSGTKTVQLVQVADAILPQYALASPELGWTLVIDASKQTPQSDGTTLTAITDFSGNGNTQTQGTTNHVFYRTGANGVNGQPVYEFDGSGYTRSTAGGAALNGDFTIVAVVQFTNTNVDQSCVCWGDTSNTTRRAFYRYATDFSIGGILPADIWGFNGINCDFPNVGVADYGTPLLTLVQNTWYVVAIVKQGNYIYRYVNGQLVDFGPPGISGATLGSYTSTTITVGANQSGGENGTFNLAFLGLMPNAMAPSRLQAITNKLCERYGILTSYTSSDVVFFPFYADGEVQFINWDTSTLNSFTQNCMSLWHYESTGDSVVRFRKCGQTNGQERGAVGYDDQNSVFAGSDFIESSNLDGSSAPTPFRNIMTGVVNGTFSSYLRTSVNADGSIHWYALAAATLPPNDWFHADSNGNIIVGSGPLTTSATNGFFVLATCSGTPTGTPTAGAGACVYDTSGKHLWIYNGSSWESH